MANPNVARSWPTEENARRQFLHVAPVDPGAHPPSSQETQTGSFSKGPSHDQRTFRVGCLPTSIPGTNTERINDLAIDIWDLLIPGTKHFRPNKICSWIGETSLQTGTQPPADQTGGSGAQFFFRDGWGAWVHTMEPLDHTHVYAGTRAHTHTQKRARAHTHTHTLSLTHTRARTHTTHARTWIFASSVPLDETDDEQD